MATAQFALPFCCIMSNVLVIGAGAIGLRTALELAKRNLRVTLRAPRHSLHETTCSMGAGGLWMPVHSPDVRTHQWALETLDELWPMAVASANGCSDDKQTPLVEQLMAVVLKRQHSEPVLQEYEIYQQQHQQAATQEVLPSWASDVRLEFQHLTVEMLAWQNSAFRLRIPPQEKLIKAGYSYAWLFKTVVVNAPHMLQHMLDELSYVADVHVDTKREYESLDEMVQDASDHGCDTLVNCTGLGAATLCRDDKDLVGGRGIVHLYDRTSATRTASVLAGPYGDHVKDAVILTDEEPWATPTMPAYLIPRGDVLVLGGSMLKGDTETGIRASERSQLLRNAEHFGIDTEQCEPISEWVGFRPYRQTVRVEVDEAYKHSAVKVVHNYGHGGSGWTINVGCARECADLITGPR
ncbi:hypothetical protein MPSEU_000087300 [Mayamaea pseudoterrestris]|nr:hypothetical protein MPSEU_000087300 [Mayamaea pseudoterrestris]